MTTRLFEFISTHGHSLARSRARRKDPEYSARDDARHIKEWFVLGTEGPGGLDGLFSDMALVHKYNPWWLTVSLRVHWWLDKHGPGATYRNFIAFWQRGKRGWSDRDTWGFDTYLAGVIRDGVQSLNDNKHGWPGDPMTYEEWGQILTEISVGMQAHLDVMDLLTGRTPEETQQAAAKRDLALDHLKAYWGHLWD